MGDQRITTEIALAHSFRNAAMNLRSGAMMLSRASSKETLGGVMSVRGKPVGLEDMTEARNANRFLLLAAKNAMKQIASVTMSRGSPEKSAAADIRSRASAEPAVLGQVFRESTCRPVVLHALFLILNKHPGEVAGLHVAVP